MEIESQVQELGEGEQAEQLLPNKIIGGASKYVLLPNLLLQFSITYHYK